MYRVYLEQSNNSIRQVSRSVEAIQKILGLVVWFLPDHSSHDTDQKN